MEEIVFFQTKKKLDPQFNNHLLIRIFHNGQNNHVINSLENDALDWFTMFYIQLRLSSSLLQKYQMLEIYK